MIIVKNIVSVLSRDVFLYFVNIITGILVARKLGPDLLGLWFIISLIPLYAESFFRTKADVASVYFFGKEKYSKYEILSSLNYIAFASSVVFIILIFLFFDYLYSFLCNNCNDNYSNEFKNILLIVPISFLSLNYSYFHISQNNVKIFNYKSVIYSISYGALTVFLLYSFNMSLWALIIGSIVAHLLSLIYGVYNVRNKLKFFKPNWNLKISLLKYGFNFYVNGIISFFQNEGVKNISLIFLSTSGIAFLGQGKNISDLMFKINNAIETILYPTLSKIKNNKQAIQNVLKSFRFSFYFMLIIGVCLFFLAESLIVLLYGKEFIDSALVVKILVPSIIILGSSTIFNSYYYSKGRADIVPKISLVPSIFQLILGYFLTKKFGLIGAAISISIGFFLQSILMIIVFIKDNNLKFNILLPKKEDFLDFNQFIKYNLKKNEK